MVFFISTYTDGVPPENAAWFYKYITEAACDFRFQIDAFKGLLFSVCGLGNSLYEENFNKVAIELDKSFSHLQATRIAPLYCCDENTIKSRHGSLEADVEFWQNNFFEKLEHHLRDQTESEVVQKVEQKVGSCCKSEKKSRENGSECCNEESGEGCCSEKKAEKVKSIKF